MTRTTMTALAMLMAGALALAPTAMAAGNPIEAQLRVGDDPYEPGNGTEECGDGYAQDACRVVCNETYPTRPEPVGSTGCAALEDTAYKDEACTVWYAGPYPEKGCPSGKGGDGGNGGNGGNGGDGCRNSTVIALNEGCGGGLGGGGGSGGAGGGGGDDRECETYTGNEIECAASPPGDPGNAGDDGENGTGSGDGLNLWNTLGVNPFDDVIYPAQQTAARLADDIRDGDFPTNYEEYIP